MPDGVRVFRDVDFRRDSRPIQLAADAKGRPVRELKVNSLIIGDFFQAPLVSSRSLELVDVDLFDRSGVVEMNAARRNESSF